MELSSCLSFGWQIVLCLLLVAILLAVGNSVFSDGVMRQEGPLSAMVFNGNPAYSGFLVYWSYIILLSPAMPIALYITLGLLQWCVVRKGGHTCMFVLCLQVRGDPHHPQPLHRLGPAAVLAAGRQTGRGQEHLAERGAGPGGIPAE